MLSKRKRIIDDKDRSVLPDAFEKAFLSDSEPSVNLLGIFSPSKQDNKSLATIAAGPSVPAQVVLIKKLRDKIRYYLQIVNTPSENKSLLSKVGDFFGGHSEEGVRRAKQILTETASLNDETVLKYLYPQLAGESGPLTGSVRLKRMLFDALYEHFGVQKDTYLLAQAICYYLGATRQEIDDYLAYEGRDLAMKQYHTAMSPGTGMTAGPSNTQLNLYAIELYAKKLLRLWVPNRVGKLEEAFPDLQNTP